MSGEMDLYGVYFPSLLVWMVVALIPTWGVRFILLRLNFYQWVWHRSLFNFALYVIVLGGTVSLAAFLKI